LHGKPSTNTFKSISTEVKSAVNYVVNFRQNEEIAYSASSIIKWKNGQVSTIRL
jgi:hypothetical protein